MYKILIVEDEFYIRKGIRNLIDFESINCTVLDEAENGMEALNILKEEEIDIVITDIRMPIIDGLELMKKALDLSVVFVILSGYDDFEYAREALRYGASSYLLKPIEESKLKEALIKAKEDLRLKRLSEELSEQKENIKEINLLDIYPDVIKEDIVSQMIDYVKENYSSKFKMEDLVDALHYSETSLNQKFKATMGTTFNNFLNQYRIQKAMELILEGTELTDIYMHVGFSEDKYFKKVFEKYTGVSPSVFKKSQV